METNIVEIKEEINKQVAQKEVLDALITITFKGLEIQNIKRAMLEGMMRGFKFKDFLEKNIYAIPFGSSYSLVTSIDYARKIGMKSGIVGKSAPAYKEKENGDIESCTITVKRKVNEYIGEYSATVFFKEYSTGRNLWLSKPRTMIAKVAEMHALRMACPEELAQSYAEEEMEKEIEGGKNLPEVKIEEFRTQLKACQNLKELKKIWSSIPVQAKLELENLKEELKAKYDNKKPKEGGETTSN